MSGYLKKPCRIKLSELPIPEPGVGQLRVRVIATGINPIDIKVRKVRLPMTPTHFPRATNGLPVWSMPLARGVSDFLAGDEVFGFSGGFRGLELTRLGPGRVHHCRCVTDCKKPARLSFRAAALPLVAVTA
jgi:NADPH:quinone reductase-like Zn-dependent oxidoreductase